MLNLIIAEAALETIPEPIWKHPIIIKDALKRGKDPQEILLDRSYHHKAMEKMDNSWKRGRPDIAHFCLLEALGSPLNKENKLATFLHSITDLVFDFDPSTRLPRNCVRFKGLIEQAIRLGRVPLNGKSLISVTERRLEELVKDVNPTFTIALSTLGKKENIEEVASILNDEEKPLLIIGGFPAGHFSKKVVTLVDEVFCVYPKTLDAGLITGRILHEFEKTINLWDSSP
jgi:rRNA small subunit pseudouridine methyltransferase Nep1